MSQPLHTGRPVDDCLKADWVSTRRQRDADAYYRIYTETGDPAFLRRARALEGTRR